MASDWKAGYNNGRYDALDKAIIALRAKAALSLPEVSWVLALAIEDLERMRDAVEATD